MHQPHEGTLRGVGPNCVQADNAARGQPVGHGIPAAAVQLSKQPCAVPCCLAAAAVAVGCRGRPTCRPSRMASASSGVGSSTTTGWKRLRHTAVTDSHSSMQVQHNPGPGQRSPVRASQVGEGQASPLQRCIPLNVLAVLVQRGGANALQVAPRQRRLNQVADVQAAAAAAATAHRPRANKRVHLHERRGRGSESKGAPLKRRWQRNAGRQGNASHERLAHLSRDATTCPCGCPAMPALAAHLVNHEDDVALLLALLQQLGDTQLQLAALLWGISRVRQRFNLLHKPVRRQPAPHAVQRPLDA